jgi:hypothetical protein
VRYNNHRGTENTEVHRESQIKAPPAQSGVSLVNVVTFQSMRHLVLLLLLLVIIPGVQASQGCDGNILVTINRQPCFGDCPGYSAKIYTDGTAVYNGTFNVKEWVSDVPAFPTEYSCPHKRVSAL